MTVPVQSNPARALAFVRNTWRGLTSMRTALILLFLLALAAMPGALLPQYSLNPAKVAAYIAEHGWWGKLLDKLEFYSVYSSVWFSAIYILLFISLVGCLFPRAWDFTKEVRAKPVLTPRNLARLPYHAEAELSVEPAAAMDIATKQLSRWRKVVRTDANGVITLSAERGYLRETGNLLFHFGLLGLVVALALGKMFVYSGQVIVVAGSSSESEFCNSGVLAYDSFDPGLQVDGTDLAPFCVKVKDFTAHYTTAGEAEYYESNIEYSTGTAANNWQPYALKVNSPLRTEGDRIYLLGHGYSPVFTVTFPNGQTRTMDTQWKPDDPTTMLSEGATKFDAAGYTDETDQRKHQIAITGLFAPTAIFNGTLMSSTFPSLENPGVAVDIYEGDTGVDSGISQNIFTIDTAMIDQKRLVKQARVNLTPGQKTTLKDGTVVSFDGVKQWVSLQVSHDPTQNWVLIFAIALLVGLFGSLTIKRRRYWIRMTPIETDTPDGRTVIEVGGLAKTDQAGYGEEFTKVTRALLAALPTVTKKEG
jgi:cytochrome c biogenesis protein